MTRQRFLATAAASLTLLYLTGAAQFAQAAAIEVNTQPVPTEIRLDTPSGYPVPRLVSLKSKKTFCRAGPTFSHPVRLTFLRQGLPVLVIAETHDHWRKIRDPEGDECWTHKSKLSGAKTALVIEDGLALYSRPDSAASQKARLGRGVIAKVDEIRDGWIKISADGLKGWAKSSAFWGAGAPAPLTSGPILNAASHN